jgi:cytoskeletal protein RodZ
MKLIYPFILYSKNNLGPARAYNLYTKHTSCLHRSRALMSIVTKYRKRPLFHITCAGLLVLLAGLALAPEFQAYAKTALTLADGKSPLDTTQPQVIPHHSASPDNNRTPSSDRESRGEAAPVAQPESKDEQPGLDEETTFAIGEPAVNPSYASHQAQGLAAMPGGGGGSATGKHGKSKPQLAAALPTERPDKNTNADGADTGATNGPTDSEAGPRDNTNPTNLPVASVPEPSSILLLAVGLLGLAFARRLG